MAPRTRRKDKREEASPVFSSAWLPDDPSKAWFEVFSFFYSFTWIAWVLCILVPFKLYEGMGPWGYMGIGVGAAAPCVVLPYFFEPPEDARRPFFDKYWVRAQIWIAVFSFVGNYVWTHYFYRLLGAVRIDLELD
mgnify:CR=1 FL=1